MALSTFRIRKNQKTGKEAAHALETLVETRVQMAARVWPNRMFLWIAVCLAGMTTRKDLMGVTSIVRTLGVTGRVQTGHLWAGCSRPAIYLTVFLP